MSVGEGPGWYLLNLIGSTLAGPFEKVGSFSEGMAPVCLGNKFGYINRDGRIVIAPAYDAAMQFRHGLAAVNIGGQQSPKSMMLEGGWGIIDQAGRMRINTVLNLLPRIGKDRVFVVRDRDSTQTTVLDPDGHTQCVVPFVVCGDPDAGKPASVLANHAFGYVNARLELIIPCQFSMASEFSEGLAAVMAKFPTDARISSPVDFEKGYIDESGQLVIPYHFKFARKFSGGMAAVDYGSIRNFINTGGAEAFKLVPQDIGDFSEGLAAIKANFRWGYIDQHGNVVVQPIFESARAFNSGRAAVQENGNLGYIDRGGKLVISTNSDQVLDFSEGLAFIHRP